MSTTADGSQMFLKRDLRMSGDRRFFKCFIACVWSKKASVLLCIHNHGTILQETVVYRLRCESQDPHSD